MMNSNGQKWADDLANQLTHGYSPMDHHWVETTTVPSKLYSVLQAECDDLKEANTALQEHCKKLHKLLLITTIVFYSETKHVREYNIATDSFDLRGDLIAGLQKALEELE